MLIQQWQANIGGYVKFVDEEAVHEARIAGTRYPMLYVGKLIDVHPMQICQDETLYAEIKPMWTDEPKFVPVSQVRLVD